MAVTINGTSGLTFNDSSTLPSATFSTVYPITASVGASALTVTLNPCSLAFRSSTLTSGTTVTRTVSTAISMTVSSGSTLGTVSAQQSRIIVLAIDNAGTVELAVVNISGGTQLDETNLVTTTAEGGAGAADSASTVYSTTARTSLAYRVVGFIQSTQATAGTWATAPSTIQGYGGNAVADMGSIGYGQTYSAPTRALATTYYNTTGKPITCVVVGSSGAGNFGSMSVSINGATAFIFAQSQNSSGTVACSGTFIVPANVSYIVTANNIGLGSWNELR
jgi:hypothetical protein